MGMDMVKTHFSASVFIAIMATSTSVAFAAVSYPVQELRFGIAKTDRNIVISGKNVGDYLTSNTLKGTTDEKWSLNYISAGVYEIANSATGMIVTNENGLATIAKDTDGANQRWKIEAVEKDFEGYDLYYKIVSNADGKSALTFDASSNSFNVDAYTGDSFQKFKLNLDGLEGFAANALAGGKEKAGTIGGLLGATVEVTTVKDLVAALNKTEPLTIVLNGNLDMASWNKTDQRIRDNKTLVGSYANNTIYDCQLRNDDFYGKDATPSNNIVIRNLNLVARQLNSSGSGVILLQIYGGRNIWIDHNNFSATFGQNKDKEVGKFIWINTPALNWSDAIYNGVNPDYITISYNYFKNRFWTVAFGSQNKDTSRLRTTLMFNKWEQCSRRTPQYSNGFHHNYSEYHTVTGSSNPNASSQVIGGEGSRTLSENSRFEAYSGKEFDIDKNSALGFYDYNSYTSGTVGGTPSKVNAKGWGVSWKATENYGYHLVDGYNANGNDTKSFTNAYSGCFKKVGAIKYITDSDLNKYVSASYKASFLKSVEVGSAPVGKDPIDIETPEGSLIQNLTIEDRANASGWGISSIKLDGKIFGDRDFTFTTVPDSVKGAEQIVTACNSKNSTKDVASFIVAKDLVLYVGLDSRVEKVPEWLSAAKKTEMKVVASNDVTFEIYKIEIDSGKTFTLGSNGQSSYCVNYIAFVQEAKIQSGESETEIPLFAIAPKVLANMIAVNFVDNSLFVNNGSGTVIRVTLFDMNGSVIVNRIFASGNHTLETKGLARGTYLVRIHGKNVQKTFRINRE